MDGRGCGQGLEGCRDCSIPRKGDLRDCNNWRGISLLDIVGKLFGRILQDRLQLIAEKVLPESQCGFRKGRGCVDMIFTVRQLFEKSREHDESLFVDLRKTHDTVSREALWQVLGEIWCSSSNAPSDQILS